MNGKALRISVAALCLSVVVGCAEVTTRAPIINPQQIDQKEAKEKLIPMYVDIVAKTNRMGFDYATAICRRIQAGEITLDRVKSSENGRYVVYMFKEKEGAGSSGGDYSIIAFYFNPVAELMLTCSKEGLCDVYLKDGVTRFGRIDVVADGEPVVTDKGITMKFKDDRSYSFDLLFSYLKANQQEGDELITIFLSAFPFLFYQ
ncbi:MAG: hypothetical protein LLG97_00885 [Deltaproteobacteria bacterium]|nr:hypothetical protein [Deltaproteobacteria bacterium]